MHTTTSSPTDAVVPAQRLDLAKAAPDSNRAMAALERSIALDPELRELIKIRASQLNGCAYCLDLHLHDAREMGLAARRLDTLAGWHESPFFTVRERAALALTEEMTKLSEHGVSDAVWDEVARHYDEAEAAQLVWAITAINAWNRLAVATRKTLPTR